MTEIYIVRHGQAAFGTDDYDRLSAQGRQQSRRLGEYFRDIGLVFGSVYTGTLRRHRETLDALAVDDQQMPAPNSLPGLNEYDFHLLVMRFAALQRQHVDMGIFTARCAMRYWLGSAVSRSPGRAGPSSKPA